MPVWFGHAFPAGFSFVSEAFFLKRELWISYLSLLGEVKTSQDFA